MTMNLVSPTIVSDPQALRQLATQLQNESLVAVDTESNSLFAYREQVCLIQISTRTTDWVVDPLAVQDMSPLAALFADPRIEKVFHAAEYDLMCMKRDFDFTFNHLFDTMVAARILGYKAVGLANLLEQHFGIQVDKKYQRADWSQRPIPAEQLKYAQEDTHYLPVLRDILLKEIEQRNCLVEAHEVFALMTNVPPASQVFDPEGYWRISAARDFSRRQMAILRELYLLRDQIAERRNRPPFKIFGDDVLVNIVKREPHTLQELSAIPGMSHGQMERYGERVLQAIQKGTKARLPPRPDRTPRVEPIIMARYDVLHEWRKARAIERGVESDVIIPKETLWALARNAPNSPGELDNIPGLGPWKKEKYGAELLRLLAAVAEQDA